MVPGCSVCNPNKPLLSCEQKSGKWRLKPIERLWGLAVTGFVTWIVVKGQILERIDARLGNRSFALRTFVICTTVLGLSNLLSFPWALYEDWWREMAYGRTSQPLDDFLLQGSLALLLSTLLGGCFFLGVYAVIRQLERLWWFWSGVFTTFTISALMLAGPVLIEPLFNQYGPLPEGPVSDALVEMAAEVGIPKERIFVYDGSRQSNNFTANVAGIGSSARIAISDVAFKGATLDEVRAVTAHEMGHYLLGHVWRSIAFYTVLSMLFFFFADRMFDRMARVIGSQASISQPVGMPVLLFIISVLGLLAEPLTNTMTRIGELEADRQRLTQALAAGMPETTSKIRTAFQPSRQRSTMERWRGSSTYER